VLTETGGRIAEFVNPKYADAEKVASPVRTPNVAAALCLDVCWRRFSHGCDTACARARVCDAACMRAGAAGARWHDVSG